MKLSRKILSLVLALVMVLSLATTAFAEGGGETTTETGSITIENALGGETYHAYRILDLESYDADKKIYAYKANSAWEAWLKEDAQAYVSINPQGYVTWVEGADKAAFAKAAKGQLSDKIADGQATLTADGSATISNLKLGYYLVDSTVGTLCSLDTTNPSVVMREKNEVPTIKKEVQEDSNESWGDVNDADIGQDVNFRSTVSAKHGARNYVVHDKMDAALKFDSVTSIMAGSKTLTESDYTVVTTGLTDGCTFHIVFAETYLNSITADTNIVINYTAKLTSSAAADTGYVNDTWLDYGDKQHTEHDTTTTYTWKLPIYKYHMNGENKTALPGAEFILYKGSEEPNRDYAKVTDGKLTGWTQTKVDILTRYARKVCAG